MSSPQSHDFVVPPGYAAPFAIITPTDHTGWIIVSTALGISLTLFFAVIRLFVRCVISRGFGWDDHILFAATFLATVQSALVLIACSLGLGKSVELLSEGHLEEVQKLYYASNLFFALALGLSKASVAAFLLRVAPFNPHRRVTISLLAFVMAWTVALLLVMAIRCSATSPWLLVGKSCSNGLLRLEILEAFGCAFEAAVVAVACWLVCILKTTKLEDQVTVVVIFSFRLLLLASVIFRLLAYDESGESTDPTLLEAPYITWTQTELNYSIISATILVLRPFINSLATNYGGHGRSSSSKETFSESYQLHLLGFDSNTGTWKPSLPRLDSVVMATDEEITPVREGV